MPNLRILPENQAKGGDGVSVNLDRRERIRRMMDASLRARGRMPTVREIAEAEGITVKNAWRYMQRIREEYEKEGERFGRHENP